MNKFSKALFAATFALAATPAMTALAQQTSVDAGETIVASGVWEKASFVSKGEWRIVQRGEEFFVVLDNAFSTRGAPDLKLFLSPQSEDTLTGKNATQGAILIAPLASNRGAQEYKIPSGTNLADFETLIIHCEQYSKLWSTAAL